MFVALARGRAWIAAVLSLPGTVAAQKTLDLDAAAIEVAVESEQREKGVPGYSVGIVVGDRLEFARAFGQANRSTREPARVETPYQIGSITKVFTATLLALLRDEGALRLDDSLAQHLPVETRFGKIPAGTITLRHLATHASGLPRDPVGVDRKRPMTAAALLGSLGNAEPILPTGMRFSYSNLGYALLGHVLERASKRSYPDLLRTRLLDPLGMKSTRVALGEADAEGLAAHYWTEDGGRVEHPPWLFGEACGAGGILSNVPDLAKFLSMQFRTYPGADGPVPPDTLRELHTPQRLHDDSWERAIGLGWWIVHGDYGDVVHHGGEVDGQSAAIGFVPEHAVGVIVLANLGGDSAEPLARRLMRIAVGAAAAERAEARRLHQAQEWEASMAACERLLERNPGDGWAHYALAFARLRTNDFGGSAAEFDRAGELGFNIAVCAYNAACAFALGGKKDLAFDRLRQARLRGFRDREQVLSDPDLASLRDDPRWKALLEGR